MAKSDTAKVTEEEQAPAQADNEEDSDDLEDAELLAEVAEDIEAEEEEPVVLVRPEEAERLGDLDALGTYLREIGRYPLLNAAQEVELAKRIENGVKSAKRMSKDGAVNATKKRELQRTVRDGEMAKHDMVQANLRLVVSIARRYRATGIPLLDLVQEGNIGLMRAVDKFDWRKGFKFSTYATWWIRQAIQRGIADRGRAIRLPVHVHELLVRVRRARAELEAQYGREATDEEVARAARLPVARVRELRGLAANLLSLETPVGEAGEATLGEFVPDEAAAGQFDEVLSGIGREELEKVLSTLTEREQKILALRFGLTGEEPLTLEEVGRRFGLTRERIRQLEAKALAKLRHPSRSAALRTET
jgi:RNA polymerase sigma factor (sigma-70 family)